MQLLMKLLEREQQRQRERERESLCELDCSSVSKQRCYYLASEKCHVYFWKIVCHVVVFVSPVISVITVLLCEVIWNCNAVKRAAWNYVRHAFPRK